MKCDEDDAVVPRKFPWTNSKMIRNPFRIEDIVMGKPVKGDKSGGLIFRTESTVRNVRKKPGTFNPTTSLRNDDDVESVPLSLPAPKLEICKGEDGYQFVLTVEPEQDLGKAEIEMFEIFVSHRPVESNVQNEGSDWEVALRLNNAPPLPKICSLTHVLGKLRSGLRYFVTARVVDIFGRAGPFSRIVPFRVGRKGVKKRAPNSVEKVGESAKTHFEDSARNRMDSNSEEQDVCDSGGDRWRMADNKCINVAEATEDSLNEVGRCNTRIVFDSSDCDEVLAKWTRHLSVEAKYDNQGKASETVGLHRRFMTDSGLSPSLYNGAVVIVNFFEDYRILTVNAKEDDAAVEALFRKIQAHAAGVPGLRRIPARDEIVIAPNDDGYCYRARVENCSGTMVEVEFIEYGDSVVVHYSQLKELSAELSGEPIYGIKFCLMDVPKDLPELPELNAIIPMEGQLEVETTDNGTWMGNFWLLNEDRTLNDIVRETANVYTRYSNAFAHDDPQ